MVTYELTGVTSDGVTERRWSMQYDSAECAVADAEWARIGYAGVDLSVYAHDAEREAREGGCYTPELVTNVRSGEYRRRR